MKFTLIHGLFVFGRGRKSIDKVEEYILYHYPDAVIDKDEADYGWKGVLGARHIEKNTDVIDRIAETLKDTDVVFAHSNGARFCMKALQKIDNPKIKLVFFSPALDADWEFSEVFERCTVFCTKGDFPLRLAKLIPCSEMGDMGRVGAETDQSRVGNVYCHPDIKNHSQWFKKNKIQDYFEASRALNDLTLESYKRLGEANKLNRIIT